MTCAKYADKLIEKFKNHRGRIGTHCDACEDKNCLHNATHLETNGFKKDYGLLKTE